jgi:hypothetical protein
MSGYGEFLSGLSDRLRNAGFKLHDIPPGIQYKLEIVASDTKLSNFRNSWCHVILVVTSDTPSMDYVKKYSDYAWNFSLANKPRLVDAKPRQIPRVRMVAIPSVVSNTFGSDLRESIVNSSPPHHGGDQFEFPVLLALDEKKIYYSQKGSIFGAGYIKGVREFAQRNLGFPIE